MTIELIDETRRIVLCRQLGVGYFYFRWADHGGPTTELMEAASFTLGDPKLLEAEAYADKNFYHGQEWFRVWRVMGFIPLTEEENLRQDRDVEAALRSAALAKLTPWERAALGLPR
jgi:hypothetical protein